MGMAWKLDLKKYADETTIFRGTEFYQRFGISSCEKMRLLDGGWHIQGKAIDEFQFVNHPWVKAADGEDVLTGFGCDCGPGRSRRQLCEHCVALCLRYGAEVDFCFEEPVPPEPRPEPFVPIFAEPVSEEPEEIHVPSEEPQEEPEAFPLLPEETEEEPETTLEEPAEAEEPEQIPVSMEILFGHTQEPEEPVLWCPNDTEQVLHTNMGIIGTMGTGKTQFTKSLVAQLCREMDKNYGGEPMGILIFDYKGDYNETKQDFVATTKARILKPYRLPYNPLALHRTKAYKPLLPLHTANEFKDTICKIYKDLGPKQQQLLLNCIMKAYERQGIDPADSRTWDRVAPTFDQVYRVFEEETVGRPVDSLNAAMNKIYQFCLFEGNPRRAMTLERLLRGVVVIDLSGYDSDIQNLIVAITLDQFYAQMQKIGSSATDGRYRQLRNFILVDEADGFMSQGFPSLRKIMKEGREFGVGVILSTQSLSHFTGGDDNYSRYVLTWVVHNVNDLKQKDVEYVFRLQPKSPEIPRYYAMIRELHKHESVVKLNNDLPVRIQDKAFWQLYREMNP